MLTAKSELSTIKCDLLTAKSEFSTAKSELSTVKCDMLTSKSELSTVKLRYANC